MNSSFFSSLLSSIADSGRTVPATPAAAAHAPYSAVEVAALARDLVSRRGEASGVARAREIFAAWDGLDKAARRDLLILLANDFGPDPDRLDRAIHAWHERSTPAALQELHAAAEPKRQEVIRRLNLAPRGTSKLVRMREELFEHQKQHPALGVLDEDFTHLFSSWFNPGFLVLRRIDWSTPANILEKIIRYEAVHAIRGWDDLRRRIEPEDRRLFAFFHPQMVDDPLIFVEVALTEYVPGAIEPLLAEARTPCPPGHATTAVFYSISNCQKGLRGVSFGNFLIKQVVEELKRELPSLSTFVTLSPVPGFASWLAGERRSDPPELAPEDLALLRTLDDPQWPASAETSDRLRPALLAAAAAYLLTARTADGKPLDPVARFHLGNGARLDRLNYLGDTSPKGLAQAHGLMVNYLYDLASIERNHEAFAENGQVASSAAVQSCLRPAGAHPVAHKCSLAEEVSMDANLFKVLRERDPAATFIETLDGRKITSADAIEQSGQIANVLVSRGVRPGDRVAVQVEKSAEAIMLYLACLRSGAVYLPLNSAYTLAELEYFIGDAEPRVVVCAPERQEALTPVAKKLGVAAVETLGSNRDGTLLDLAAASPAAYADVARAAGDLAAILYTSGTTGRSKGAMLTHGNLSSNALALRDTWHFTSKDVLMHALPIFHTHGLFVATNLILLSGASMIFMPKFEPNEIFKHMPRATVLMGVPTFYVRLLQDKRLSPETTKGMRLFIAGSAPLLAETHREWKAATGHDILERYGMTETNMLTSNPYTGERVAGSVGKPLPGVELRVADSETGRTLAAGEVGMIEVKGPNVFKGYWRMPEKTKAEFRDDGFFITGDLGKIGQDGYVSIVGRGKDLVITGGYNVYPKEVEIEIDAIPGIVESAVIGVPHKDFGEGVTAVIVKQQNAGVDERAVLKALDGRLAKFKLPKAVMFVEALPRNTMGKVLKNDLRERYKDIYAPK